LMEKFNRRPISILSCFTCFLFLFIMTFVINFIVSFFLFFKGFSD
jgi:hypothetical protein